MSQRDNNRCSIPLDGTKETCYSNRESDDSFPTIINNDWVTDNRSRRNKYHGKRSNIKIPFNNRFDSLYVDDDNISDEPIIGINERIEKHVGNSSKRSRAICKIPKNANRVFVKKHPESNTLPLKNVGRQLSSSYEKRSYQSTKRNKIVVISDSITKPIGMREFNNIVINVDAVKRAYGGATASRLNYYAKAIIEDEKPLTIIIFAGTNNFTKKTQSAEETTEEIMDIVNTCRRHGVERIFVSSITCRPDLQTKVDKVNNLLKYHAGIYKFVYIDNACIESEHINKREGVHLLREGVRLLANNYLAHINSHSIIPFASIWD